MITLGHSNAILMDVDESGVHQYCFFMCYSKKCKDDPDDNRARRKSDTDWEDKELSINQWRKDKGDNEGRPHLTVKGQQKTALVQLVIKESGKRSAAHLRDMKKRLAQGLDKECMEK